MLHIINTNNDDIIKQCIDTCQHGDHVIFVGIWPTTNNLALIQKNAKHKDLHILVTRNNADKTNLSPAKTELTTIDYDKLVDICIQHPTTHTWF